MANLGHDMGTTPEQDEIPVDKIIPDDEWTIDEEEAFNALTESGS